MIKTVLGSAAADFQPPWAETLQENRNNWQKKVVEVEKIIITFNYDCLHSG